MSAVSEKSMVSRTSLSSDVVGIGLGGLLGGLGVERGL